MAISPTDATMNRSPMIHVGMPANLTSPALSE
jgi:hypothetical protein